MTERSNMEDTHSDQILERLDTLARLLALELTEGKTATEGIRLLKLAGFDNKTVAQLLNVKPEAVRAISSALRRAPARRRRRAHDE